MSLPNSVVCSMARATWQQAQSRRQEALGPRSRLRPESLHPPALKLPEVHGRRPKALYPI